MGDRVFPSSHAHLPSQLHPQQQPIAPHAMPHKRRLSAPYRPCVLRTYATVLVCQGLPRVVRKPSASSCAAIWARVSPCAWRACMRRKARSTSGGGGASWGGRCAGCRAGCCWLLRGRFFSKIRFDRVADDVCQIPAWADRGCQSGCQYGRKADSNAGWGHSRASKARASTSFSCHATIQLCAPGI